MHTIKKSGTGTGVQYAEVKLSPGTYVFDSIAVTMAVDYSCRGSVKIKYEITGEEYEYTTLGGGWLARGMPIQVVCPKEIIVKGECWIYSSVYHQSATDQHQLELNYRRLPYELNG